MVIRICSGLEVDCRRCLRVCCKETGFFGCHTETFVDFGMIDFDCFDKVVLLIAIFGYSQCCSSNPCIGVCPSSLIYIGCLVDNLWIVQVISTDIKGNCFDSRGMDLFVVVDKIDMDSSGL